MGVQEKTATFKIYFLPSYDYSLELVAARSAGPVVAAFIFNLFII